MGTVNPSRAGLRATGLHNPRLSVNPKNNNRFFTQRYFSSGSDHFAGRLYDQVNERIPNTLDAYSRQSSFL